MRLFLVFTALIHVMFAPAVIAAQQPAAQSAKAGTVRGEVSAQGGTIALGGVLVTLSSGTTQVGQVVSEGDGKFRFDGIAPGDYDISATLDGFESRMAQVHVGAGQTVEIKLDLRLSEQVNVTAEAGVLPAAGTISSNDSVGNQELDQLGSGGGLSSALRLLISVIEVPGGLSIKGGRPNQASVQLGPGLFVDPATGLTQGSLPDDAIDSVTVLPNPYAVEFGRFSSGLVVIQTRQAGDKWKMRLGNLDPSFRTSRGTLLQIQGIAAFSPRMEIGGPIVKDRVFVHQSVQYRYRANDVASRPESELQTSHRLSSFTRLDATMSDRHSLVAVGGFFPSKSMEATLGTFTPPNATVDIDGNVGTVGMTERTIWSDTKFSETTVEFNKFHADVNPQGPLDMQQLPETTVGNFFNIQKRSATSFQFVHSFSGTSQSRLGIHIYKAGFDLLQSRYNGTSESRPLLIRLTNGVLTRRLDYGPATTQSKPSTDVALFLQDRIQPNNRWYFEVGARLDRDGVISRFNVTPRVGAAVLLNKAGTAVVRGGYGLFFERTPSTAGVFQQFEEATETRYAPDGITPLGPPVLFAHTIPDPLRTPRSATWDVAYDYKLNQQWELHVSGIDRSSSRELIVDRITTGTLGEWRLQSAGRSRYRELELGVHYSGGPGLDLKASYVRSQARADLNAYTAFYDAVMAPVLGENAYAPARADAPHRFLARWRAMPRPDWLLIGVLDWRTGLPYSVVDGALDFVGPRNAERFPTYFRVDLGVEHRIKLFKFRPWVGLRADNALNYNLPADVQANNTSPLFGNFYNSEYRQFRIQFRFER